MVKLLRENVLQPEVVEWFCGQVEGGGWTEGIGRECQDGGCPGEGGWGGGGYEGLGMFAVGKPLLLAGN